MFVFLSLSKHQTHPDLIFHLGALFHPAVPDRPVVPDRHAGPCRRVRRDHREAFVPLGVLFPDVVPDLHAVLFPRAGLGHHGPAFRHELHAHALNLLVEPILDRSRRPRHHFRIQQLEPVRSSSHPVAILHFCPFEEACAMTYGLVPLVQIDLLGLFLPEHGKQEPDFRYRRKLVTNSLPHRCPWEVADVGGDRPEHCPAARSYPNRLACPNRRGLAKQLAH